MPTNPNLKLDLLKDIDFSHSKNDAQQLDILIQNIQNSNPSDQPIPEKKSSQILQKNLDIEESLKKRILQKPAVSETLPSFEVEKSFNLIDNLEVLKDFNLSSKFTVADKILGPFISIDNIPLYYSFYKYIDDFKIFFATETKAAFIIPIKIARIIIANTKSNVLTLGKGNVWIRANLLDASAPADKYVGLKITGGKITFPTPYTSVKNSTTISKTSHFEIELNLDNSYSAPVHTTDVGIDAKKLNFTPPSLLKMNYLNTKISVTQSDVFRGKSFGWQSDLYGNAANFKWNLEKLSMLLNLRVENKNFEVIESASAFYKLSGRTTVRNAFWILPTKSLTQNQSLEVKFNGALQLDLLKGLSVDWVGIRNQDSDIKVNECELTFFNGDFTLAATKSDYNFLHENYMLWQKSIDKPYKMELNLSFQNYRNFSLLAQSTGIELLAGYVDGDFLIDKPILASNKPIHPTTKKSIYIKGIIDDKKVVALMDVDLLSEDDEKNIDNTLYQFALENAYFTTSKETALNFNGNWNHENHVQVGKLFLNFLLYDVLPTLPHPYTSNILPEVIRNKKENTVYYNKIGNFQSIITWTTTDNFTAAEVNFKLSQEKFSANQPNYSLANQNYPKKGGFTLLDISTESDHWGISLNFANQESLKKISTGEVTSTGENTVTINNNNLSAPMHSLQGLTLPHVSWEPVFNQSPPNPPGNPDPEEGLLIQQNNSIPTVFSQNSNLVIPINPRKFLSGFKANLQTSASSAVNLDSKITLTLPNGKVGVVSLNPYAKAPTMVPDHLNFIMPEFKPKDQKFTGSMQFRISAKNAGGNNAPQLRGKAYQSNNIINQSGISILGESVNTIFNSQFNHPNHIDTGVPLTHIDFSGYGASTFSNWKDSSAKFAAVSQAKFDILKGRTAHEIVEVVSVIYPWGIGTSRTVTFLRNNNAVIFREDSGWVAQSDGLFDFSFKEGSTLRPNPYDFYPGLVEGLFNIRNIREDNNDIIDLTYQTNATDYFFNVDTHKVENVEGQEVVAKFVAVYFDADVKLNTVQKNVTGKQFKGYLQLMPEGSPVPARVLNEIFQKSNNSIGGSVDTTFNIEETLQKFKANRIEVSASYQNDQTHDFIFVSSVKGSNVLPAEGSWSVVEVDANSGEVSNLKVGSSTGLIKDGLRPKNLSGIFKNTNTRSQLAFPDSLKNAKATFGKTYALLQNTDTQKLLLSAPEYIKGQVNKFTSEPALLADCFRLMNSKGPFSNTADAIKIEDVAKTTMNLLPEGIKKVFQYKVPDNFAFDIVGKENDAFHIYIKYDSKDKDGGNEQKSVIDYVTDSSSVDKWMNKMHSITIAVDLLTFKPIMSITGDFGNGQKSNPSLELGQGPQLILHPLLASIYQILEFLDNLDPSNPSEAIKKGLKIAMSNSADSWEYKFKADKEISLVKFPFDPINYNSPTTPLKLDAFLRIGVYFNQPIKIPNTIDQIKPSVGSYLELGATLRVMCLSLAAATVYATGRAEVGLSADLNNPPTLYFKFGFGIELCVGLPVIGSVSVLYMVGIDMKINAELVVVGAFIYFRGRVEIAGGLVTITISIEAAGKIEKIGNGPTNCIAMCTFALDISIAFIINLNFTETWQESRQIS